MYLPVPATTLDGQGSVTCVCIPKNEKQTSNNVEIYS